VRLENREKTTHLSEKTGIDGALAECDRIPQKQLINLINFLNFQDESITVNFRHRRFGNILAVEAQPLPCLTPVLECRWVVPRQGGDNLQSYEFHNIVIPDGLKHIKLEGDPLSVRDDGFSLSLPESAFVSTSRAVRRHQCNDVDCELSQNGVIFKGKLIDFNSVSFNVEVSAIPPQSFLWINKVVPLYITLKISGEIVYSGDCAIIRHTLGAATRSFVLRPISQHVSRFRSKIVRSNRYQFSPPPHIWFTHPLTKKVVHFTVDELSGSGFSVKEFFNSSVLFAGIILPELSIEITTGVTIKCRVQVIYNTVEQISDEEATQKCGITFLDMDIQDQIKLSNMLHQQHDRKATVCATVDMDDLWRFFFEVGFIYPQKYAEISRHKQLFKETYEKLYHQHPEIARHFVYLDKGQIHGHISMIHLYQETWLFHHHAADKIASRRAGLVVLYQIGHYVNDFYNLTSTHLHYIISYFRPENRFPKRMFGGVKDSIKNAKGCSIEPFMLLHYQNYGEDDAKGTSIFSDLKAALELAQPQDIQELHFYYEQRWGGLTLNALNLTPETPGDRMLNGKYQKAGLKRARSVYALKRGGALVAIFMLTVTDFGLNLSNLANCIHAFVLDPKELSPTLFYASLHRLSEHFTTDDIPVLILGSEFTELKSIPYEKIYNCWVLNVPDAVDQYYLFTDMFLLRGQH
jgi:hypothetical protein